MKKEKSRIRAYLNITGIGFNPEEVTSLLGVTPTETWRLGDIIPKTIAKYKHDGWEISTDEEIGINLDVEKHVRELLNQIKHCSDKIKEICLRYKLDVEIDCEVFDWGNDRPMLTFSKDTLKQMADIGAELDIDYY